MERFVLLGVGRCLASFIGGSTELINLGVVFNLHLRQSFNLCLR